MIFRWMQKTQIQEQKKLLYQNTLAPQALAAYFDTSGDIEAGNAMRIIHETSAHIAQTRAPGRPLPPEATADLMRMNRALRQAYDRTAMRHVKSFDESYRPILGWKTYLEDLN